MFPLESKKKLHKKSKNKQTDEICCAVKIHIRQDRTNMLVASALKLTVVAVAAQGVRPQSGLLMESALTATHFVMHRFSELINFCSANDRIK